MKYKATWIAAALFWAAAAVLTVSAARAGGFAEFYAEHIYPIFTGSLGRAVGLLPFSLVELALYASVIAAICVIIAGIRNIAKKKVSFGAAAAAFFRRAAVITGALALLYVMFCGINYRRDTFADRSGIILEKYSAEELEALCMELVEQINKDAPLVPRDEQGIFVIDGKPAVFSSASAADPGTDDVIDKQPAVTTSGSVTGPGTDDVIDRKPTVISSANAADPGTDGDIVSSEGGIIAEGITSAQCRRQAAAAMEAAGGTFDALSGGFPLPKPIFVWQILSYQQVTGIYSPFTLEANYNRDIPGFSIPFTLCHELSHLRGFMREDEANFIAWYACAASDIPFMRYSGNLSAYIYAGNALYSADFERWRRVSTALCSEAWTDLEYSNAYWAWFEGPPAELHDQINDSYLKANGQSEGVKSYGRMVDLMLAWRKSSAVGPEA